RPARSSVKSRIEKPSGGREPVARQRPWQNLYFLPLPQKQGSLRPGVFSTRLGCCTTSSSPPACADVAIAAAGTPTSSPSNSGGGIPAAAARKAPEPCTGSSGDE